MPYQHLLQCGNGTSFTSLYFIFFFLINKAWANTQDALDFREQLSEAGYAHRLPFSLHPADTMGHLSLGWLEKKSARFCVQKDLHLPPPPSSCNYKSINLFSFSFQTQASLHKWKVPAVHILVWITWSKQYSLVIGYKDHIRNLDFLTKSYLTVLCTVRINCWTYLNFSLTRAVIPAHTSQNGQDVKVASYRWRASGKLWSTLVTSGDARAEMHIRATSSEGSEAGGRRMSVLVKVSVAMVKHHDPKGRKGPISVYSSIAQSIHHWGEPKE